VLEAEDSVNVEGVPVVAADELPRVADDAVIGVLLVVLVAEGNADVLLGEAGVLEAPTVLEIDAKTSDAEPEVGFKSEAAASVVVFTTTFSRWGARQYISGSGSHAVHHQRRVRTRIIYDHVAVRLHHAAAKHTHGTAGIDPCRIVKYGGVHSRCGPRP